MHPSTQNRRAGGRSAHFSTQSLRGGDPGCCIVPGELARRELARREPHRHPERPADPRRITALRRELAEAESEQRAQARREAKRLVQAERDALREACDSCHRWDRIRSNASARLEIIRAGGLERFRAERELAEVALQRADRADAAFTVIAFAKGRDRLRYLRGGEDREAVISEALARGGVYTKGFGGKHFQEIVR